MVPHQAMAAASLTAAALALLALPAAAIVAQHERADKPKSRASIADFRKNQEVCLDTWPYSPHECRMSEVQTCPYSSLSTEDSTMIYPGGQTRCLSNDKPDFAFQVFPGRTDKLFLMMDAGGAAWDEMSVQINAANKTFVSPMVGAGLLRKSEKNPLTDHTVIYIHYCSGDLHVGAATQSYKSADGGPVIQHGYYNTLSAVKWAQANLSPKLESLFISGTSAGAIGTQVWANYLLKTFTYSKATVLADSYVGVFPANFQGTIFQRMGVCDLDLLSSNLTEKCKNGFITMADTMEDAIRTHPTVAFASVNTKYDWVQTTYYRLTCMSVADIAGAVNFDGVQFHSRAKSILERYNQYPNFVSFMMHHDHHGFTTCDGVFRYYQKVNETKVKYTDWLRGFPSLGGKGVSSICGGQQGSDVCDEKLLNKTLDLQQ